ncbi:MAG: protein kinase [Sandaracinaceae bacterium]|nr:protein kinase [Sandaracinaceae bacterium]
MNATTDILRGELERLFDLDELKSLSADLLGLDPDQVGGTEGKGAFARALVERCSSDDALLALADAVILSKEGVDSKLGKLLELDPGEELKAGAQVAGYRVLKKIGEGSIGVVYLVEKKGERGEAAPAAPAQGPRPAFARDRAATQRWQTALRVQRTIDDAGLAPVLGVGSLEDGRPYVLSAFVEGQSLASRVGRTGPMHYNEARPIVRGVLSALETLHACNMLHGDVKTENVFIVRPSAADKMKNEPTGVLVDAGNDRLFTRRSIQVGQIGALPVVGTPKALAPEVARGGAPEVEADLYAVGCLLYEVLTGRAPFVGDNAMDVIAQHLVKEAEPPSAHAPRGWVPKELDDIVLQALAKDPSERYLSATLFREAIESIGRASIPPEARKKEALDEGAFDAAVEKLKAEPTNEELAVAVERVVEPAQAWDKAVAVFQEAAEKLDDAEGKKALLFRVARIREADLKDHAGAEAAYRAILELDETEEIARAAIEELKRASGDAEGLVELLLEKVESEESAEERAGILCEIAETYERQLDDADNAFVAWVQALAEDPRDDRTIDNVERLAGDDVARWNEAVSALNETVQETEDVAAKVQMFVLLGRWYADKLARPDFAVPCFGQALALDPANDAAMEGTIALYRKAQSWQELVTMLMQRAGSAASPVRARDLKVEAAEIVYRKLGDTNAAAEVFEQILKDDPAHPKATEALESIYSEKKDWKRLVDLLEGKAKSQRGEDRVETLCAIAELYEDRLDDLDQAAAHYEGALKHEAHHVGALKGLERIYARAGKFAELLGNLQAQLEVAATPRQKIALLERIGQIQLEEFVDHEKAAHAFAQVVEIEPGHEGANTSLARVYRHLQRFDDLAKTLERHALGTEDEERKIALLMQSAKVLMVDVGAPERALAMIDRVTAVRPDHTEALELSARLQAQTGDAHKALEATGASRRGREGPEQEGRSVRARRPHPRGSRGQGRRHRALQAGARRARAERERRRRAAQHLLGPGRRARRGRAHAARDRDGGGRHLEGQAPRGAGRAAPDAPRGRGEGARGLGEGPGARRHLHPGRARTGRPGLRQEGLGDGGQALRAAPRAHRRDAGGRGARRGRALRRRLPRARGSSTRRSAPTSTPRPSRRTTARCSSAWPRSPSTRARPTRPRSSTPTS